VAHDKGQCWTLWTRLTLGLRQIGNFLSSWVSLNFWTLCTTECLEQWNSEILHSETFKEELKVGNIRAYNHAFAIREVISVAVGDECSNHVPFITRAGINQQCLIATSQYHFTSDVSFNFRSNWLTGWGNRFETQWKLIVGGFVCYLTTYYQLTRLQSENFVPQVSVNFSLLMIRFKMYVKMREQSNYARHLRFLVIKWLWTLYCPYFRLELGRSLTVGTSHGSGCKICDTSVSYTQH
jgi:hypothetical protein